MENNILAIVLIIIVGIAICFWLFYMLDAINQPSPIEEYYDRKFAEYSVIRGTNAKQNRG